jgi:drug/metabolite transporter (DMT)-like permease
MTPRAWFGLFTLAAMWGAVYLLTEISLRELSPVLVVLGRVVLAALVLTPFAVQRRVLRPLLTRPRAVLETVAVQSTVPLLLMTFGQQHIPSALAGIIIGAQPLFVALLAIPFAPAERPQGWQGVTGIALGMIGLILIFGIDLQDGSSLLLGGALVLAAACCYAGGAIMIHRRLRDQQPLGIATAAMLVTTAVLAVPGLAVLPPHPPSGAAIAALAVLGIVCTGMTLALFYTLIAQAGPARAALAFYLSPGFAVLFGAVFLHERITVATIFGLIAIVVGSGLAARRTEVT